MDAALVLRDDNRGIAELNADVNRRRLERERERASSGGPLQVTDRAAFERFCREAAATAKAAAQAEEAEEVERCRREGAAYVPKAQREAAARARRQAFEAAGADEARGVRSWCDPSKDYYAALGLPRVASTAEVKRAYKLLAIQLHPDKHVGVADAALADIKTQFALVLEAHEVLTDHERRASYDRLRRGGGTDGAEPRTAEERAAVLQGMRELAALRRNTLRRSAKHPPLALETRVSLEKLRRGCVKRVAFTRRCVDGSGTAFSEEAAVHVVVRRGTPPGERYTFTGAGHESGELLPGDAVKPHVVFKREGAKDLACMGAPLALGDAVYCQSVTALSGKCHLLYGSAVAASLAAGGCAGFVTHVLPGEGMPDPESPWDAPPGCLMVRLRFPARPWGQRLVSSPLHQRPVLLLPSATAVLPAALAGGIIRSAQQHSAEAAEMLAEERASRFGRPQEAPCIDAGVCLVLGGEDAAPSTAAAALMAAGGALRWRVVKGVVTADPTECALLDDEWAALERGSSVVLDFDAGGDELRISLAAASFRPVLHTLWLRHWSGCVVAAVGDGAVALAGAMPGDAGRSLLPMPLRASGAHGWQGLHAALAAWPRGTPGCGVYDGSLLAVDAAVWWAPDGAAELLVAPPRDILVALAAAEHAGEEGGRYEDAGFALCLERAG